MIKLSRGSIPKNIDIYATKDSAGAVCVSKATVEVQKAIAFFENPGNFANNIKLTKSNFSFTIYKNPELATELERIFGAKCAYCESRFGHVTPKEVEHFRPKSEIVTGNGTLRPGYFWLAAEWTNLLISCVDCNRSRKHNVPGQPDKIKLGKEAQFPLSDEKKRKRGQGSLSRENSARLLIDPCIGDPGTHLTFTEEGLIHPKRDQSGTPSEMGRVSISVYALQRKMLVEERLRVLNDLRFAVGQLSFLVQNHNLLTTRGATAAELTSNINQIQSIKQKLRSMFEGGAPYLGMLREWIRRSDRSGDFALLRQFKIDLTRLI